MVNTNVLFLPVKLHEITEIQVVSRILDVAKQILKITLEACYSMKNPLFQKNSFTCSMPKNILINGKNEIIPRLWLIR